jgi:hypothetical protein
MSTTKYFLDTEFIEDGKTIDLISLGIVCEDGRELYLQNSECEFQKASDWVWRNVFPHLEHFDMRGKRRCSERQEFYDSGLGTRHHTKCSTNQDALCPWASRREIRETVLDFCSIDKHGKPEFWGYFADYDWVAFCQLFGTMVALPKGFPMYCRDIKQWADDCGDVRIPKSEVAVHHALADAKWVSEAFSFLTNHQVKV